MQGRITELLTQERFIPLKAVLVRTLGREGGISDSSLFCREFLQTPGFLNSIFQHGIKKSVSTWVTGQRCLVQSPRKQAESLLSDHRSPGKMGLGREGLQKSHRWHRLVASAQGCPLTGCLSYPALKWLLGSPLAWLSG